jgi:5-methyltetrahydropteroyltriglutamate--homocysteine methyltransferase
MLGLGTEEFLKRRIEEAAKYVDTGHLCLDLQCGSASTVDGNVLTHDNGDRESAARC